MMEPIAVPATRAQSIFGLQIALAVLCTAVITLRFWSRYTLPASRFRPDDWTALAAWPFAVVILIMGAITTHYSMGNHVLYHLYAVMITLVRASALLFYKRVFNTHHSRYFRHSYRITLACNLLWYVTAVFATTFQRDPINGFWNRLAPGVTCLSPFKFYVGLGVPATVLDIWTLVLPTPLLCQFQLPNKKKLVLGAVFTLGYGVVICQIGRMVSVIMTGRSLDADVTWSFLDIAYWYVLEVGTAFICISLPSLIQIWNRTQEHGFSAMFHNRYGSARSDLTPLTTIQRRDPAHKHASHGSNGSHGSNDIESGPRTPGFDASRSRSSTMNRPPSRKAYI